ncbi:NAD-dependent epimerase/dehydratase family protein [Chitinophaga sp. 30R24]|uniref:NAD-dependent epimerase/dehydratase family protein n=1 Tax=Chitinophaga sp. 30R24 TaxID=3248838 RepID=UPI003B90F546
MLQLRMLILGSTGFLGKNMMHSFSKNFTVLGTTRKENFPKEDMNSIYFDLENADTWQNIVDYRPDVIVNASGYGVVKDQLDSTKMKLINYYQPYLLKNFLEEKLLDFFWIQIGTAFEYDLKCTALTEASPMMPLTDYGISKVMMSQYLLQSDKRNYCIIRPFAMYGPYEDKSKIIPALILAQKNKETISLSSGEQIRDYFFVSDLSFFIQQMISRGINRFSGEIINVGSNTPVSLKKLSSDLGRYINEFDAGYWNWGALSQRANESTMFYNTSGKCYEYGFVQTPAEIAFQTTIDHFYH